MRPIKKNRAVRELSNKKARTHLVLVLDDVLPQHQSPVRVVIIQIVEHATMEVTVLIFGLGHTIKNKERRGARSV
jgi:hypothetical protein